MKLSLNKFNSNSVNTLFRDSINKMVTFDEHQSTISILFCFLKKMQGLLYMPAILVDSQKGERCRARSGEKQLNKQRELNKNILLPHATH